MRAFFLFLIGLSIKLCSGVVASVGLDPEKHCGAMRAATSAANLAKWKGEERHDDDRQSPT
jgi:hypothetical protein